MAAPKEDWPAGYAEENKEPKILIVTITIAVVALLFVAARIYSRRISTRRLATDDYIVICWNSRNPDSFYSYVSGCGEREPPYIAMLGVL